VPKEMRAIEGPTRAEHDSKEKIWRDGSGGRGFQQRELELAAAEARTRKGEAANVPCRSPTWTSPMQHRGEKLRHISPELGAGTFTQRIRV
jgi:hypothetical protein